MSNKIIVKDHKYYFKIRGLGGVKGDKGDTGPAGPQGPQGPYVDVVAGTTTTLPAGSSAQVTVNNTGNTSVLNFGIPQGLKGDKGDAGTPGAQGPRGFAATVNVGQTTTGEPGTDASVVNAGNEHDAVLKFTIPKGAKGDTGETGPQGPTGGVKSTVVAELPETGESDKYYLVNRTAEGGTVTTTDGYAQITNDENAGDLTLNKLDGNAEQKTLSGKNLSNIYAIDDISGWVTLTVANDKITISGNQNTAGYTNCGKKLSEICPTLQVGDTVYLFFDTTSSSGSKNGIHIGEYWTKNTSKTITQSMLDANVVFYGGYNETAVISNFMITKTNDSTYEPYVGGIPSPNPDYPQEIKTVTGAQTVKITGKNLLDTSNAGNQSAAGMTATWNNGTVEVKGTNTATSFPLSDNIALPTQIKAGTEVSASFAEASVGNTFFRFYNQATSQYELLSITKPNTSGTYTLTRDADAVQLYKGGVPTNTYKEFSISNWQIELGNQATTYEPYQAQSQEINLGKNLLNIPDGTYSNNGITATVADGKITLTGTATATSFVAIDIPPITLDSTWSFSLNNTVYGNSDTQIRLYKDDGTTYVGITPNVANAKSENRTNYGTYNRVQIRTASGVVAGGATAQPQVELGSIATSYAPYKTPLELAKIGTYQDYIWNDEGTWKIHKEVGKQVFTGVSGEQWAGELFGSYWRANHTFSDIAPIAQNIDFVAFSDYFHVSPNVLSSQVIGEGDFCQYRNTSTVYFAPPLSVQSSDDWRTWLSTHNTTVYYALATPTDTVITDADLIGQLDALAPASLYEGVNNIMLIPSAGAQGELALSYVLYDKYNQHQVYIWSSDDNTWQIILP